MAYKNTYKKIAKERNGTVLTSLFTNIIQWQSFFAHFYKQANISPT